MYISVLITITFFYPARERTTATYEHHFIPLQSTLAQINDPAQYDTPGYWRIFILNIAGNFLLFLPFGFLSVLLFPKKNKWVLFFYAVLTSISIELAQLIFHAGVCDIDDVILNSAGALAGIYICSQLLNHQTEHTRTCV